MVAHGGQRLMPCMFVAFIYLFIPHTTGPRARVHSSLPWPDGRPALSGDLQQDFTSASPRAVGAPSTSNRSSAASAPHPGRAHAGPKQGAAPRALRPMITAICAHADVVT